MRIIGESIGSYAGLSVSDFADYIKVDYGDDGPDNAQIANALYAAANYVEKVGYLSLANRTVTIISDTWDEMELPYAGDVSGSPTVTYRDTNNAQQTLAGDTLWLEVTGWKSSTLHIEHASLPGLYSRADAVRITMTIAPINTEISHDHKMLMYQLGAYFYDCRVNDKEPQQTVVDKIIASIRRAEF